MGNEKKHKHILKCCRKIYILLHILRWIYKFSKGLSEDIGMAIKFLEKFTRKKVKETLFKERTNVVQWKKIKQRFT